MRLIPVLALLLLSACMPSAPAPTSAAPQETPAAARVIAPEDAALGAPFVAADGAHLPMRRWLPQGRIRAVVLALHGFNDYSNAFAAAAPAFTARGIALYAYDQRGFGAAPLPGRWPGSRPMVDDAVAVMQSLRERHPGVPLYLMGESMGAAVAELAAIRVGQGAAAPDGVILLAPAVWGRDTMNLFERTGLWLADLVPSVRWSPNLIPVKIRASDNIAMLRALGADPLVIKDTRSDTLNGLVDLMGQALVAAPRFNARALVLYGEQDQIVPRHAVERFVAELPPSAAARQRVALYPAGYHLLLRDLEGARVVDDVIAWIAAPDAPLPSGEDAGARERLAGRAPRAPAASSPAEGLAAPLGRARS